MLVIVVFYGKCFLIDRKTVLSNLDFQYEGTEESISNGVLYDIYSNSDGDYFAVKEDE